MQHTHTHARTHARTPAQLTPRQRPQLRGHEHEPEAPTNERRREHGPWPPPHRTPRAQARHQGALRQSQGACQRAKPEAWQPPRDSQVSHGKHDRGPTRAAQHKHRTARTSGCHQSRPADVATCEVPRPERQQQQQQHAQSSAATPARSTVLGPARTMTKTCTCKSYSAIRPETAPASAHHRQQGAGASAARLGTPGRCRVPFAAAEGQDASLDRAMSARGGPQLLLWPCQSNTQAAKHGHEPQRCFREHPQAPARTPLPA